MTPVKIKEDVGRAVGRTGGPPSQLGSQDAWIKKRNQLAAVISNCRDGNSRQVRLERAEEMLWMIEAIGSEDVMTT